MEFRLTKWLVAVSWCIAVGTSSRQAICGRFIVEPGVVVAGARGVALSGNYANYVAVPSIRGQSASLALTPPVSRSSHVDAWVADEVQWSGNSRFSPALRILPSAPNSTLANASQTVADCPSCTNLGYASFESPSVLHRNLATKQYQDATQWVAGAGNVRRLQGLRDDAEVFEFTAPNGTTPTGCQTSLMARSTI